MSTTLFTFTFLFISLCLRFILNLYSLNFFFILLLRCLNNFINLKRPRLDLIRDYFVKHLYYLFFRFYTLYIFHFFNSFNLTSYNFSYFNNLFNFISLTFLFIKLFLDWIFLSPSCESLYFCTNLHTLFR